MECPETSLGRLRKETRKSIYAAFESRIELGTSRILSSIVSHSAEKFAEHWL
jgi:hypothetical protein